MSDTEREPDDVRAAAVHGIRSSSIARPLTEILQLGSIVVLAHLIVPSEFGHYAVALIAQEMAYILIAAGISGALIQREAVDREHMQTGMAMSMLGGLLLAALTLVAASLIVAPIFGGRTAFFVRLMVPLCLVSAAGTVPMATISRRMHFRRLSEIEVLSTVLRVAVCIGLALAGLKGEALVLGSLAGALSTTVTSWISAPPPLPHLHRKAAKEILDFGLPVSLASISWLGFSNVDYALVGARLGALQAGLYFRAYTVAVEYQSKISVVMTQVGFPVLSRTNSASELTGLHRQMVRLLTIVLFPLLAVLAIVAPTLVPFVFGHHWTGAVVPVQILAVGGASTLVIDAAGTVLMATGRTRALLGYGVGHFLAYGLAVYLVVPLGLAAVACAAAVTHSLFLVLAYSLMLRDSDERPLTRLWEDISPATVSCLGLVVVVFPLSLASSAVHLPAALDLAFLGLVAIPPYLFTLRAFFPVAWSSQLAIISRLIPSDRLRRTKSLLAWARPSSSI